MSHYYYDHIEGANADDNENDCILKEYFTIILTHSPLNRP